MVPIKYNQVIRYLKTQNEIHTVKHLPYTIQKVNLPLDPFQNKALGRCYQYPDETPQLSVENDQMLSTEATLNCFEVDNLFYTGNAPLSIKWMN